MKLRVAAPSGVFVYEAEVLEQEVSRRQEERDGLIEAADLTLALDSPDFLGVGSLFALPDEIILPGLRAQVEDDDAVLVLDGIIRLSGVVHRPHREEWTITVLGHANELLIERLEALTVTGGLELGLITRMKEKQGGWLGIENNLTSLLELGFLTGDSRQWYDLWSMWTATVAQDGSISVVYQDPAHAQFTLFVDYATGDPSNPSATIERQAKLYVLAVGDVASQVEPGLPLWTGDQLFDAMRALLGWRWRARFAAFPSTDIVLDILTDFWEETPSPLGTLDGLELEGDDPDVGFEEAAEPDFAVQWQNSVGEDPILAETFRPDPAAIYAAPLFKISADGKGEQQGLVQLPFYVCHHEERVTTGILTPDPVGHPGYQETVTHATAVVEDGKIWITEADAVENRIVAFRTPQNPAPSQLPRTAGHFAANLFRNYQLVRSAMYRVDGGFDLAAFAAALPDVGDPLAALLYLGEGWMVRMIDFDAATHRGLLELVRPRELPSFVVAEAPLSPPQNVLALATIIPAFPLNKFSTVVSWDAPAIGEATHYDVQAHSPFHPITPWYDVGTTVEPDRDLTHTGTIPVPDKYRVRARNATQTSAWAYATTQIT